MLAVPTSTFLERQKNKSRSRGSRVDVEQLMDEGGPQDQAAPDYLFILTDSFHLALLAFNQETHKMEVVSRGNVAEKTNGEKREPPYSIFLGQECSFVALMLYENVLKVIPLV